MPYNSRQFPLSKINFRAGFWHSKAKTHTPRLAKKEPEFKSTFRSPRTAHIWIWGEPTPRADKHNASWIYARRGVCWLALSRRTRKRTMHDVRRKGCRWMIFGGQQRRRTLVGACYLVGSPRTHTYSIQPTSLARSSPAARDFTWFYRLIKIFFIGTATISSCHRNNNF